MRFVLTFGCCAIFACREPAPPAAAPEPAGSVSTHLVFGVDPETGGVKQITPDEETAAFMRDVSASNVARKRLAASTMQGTLRRVWNYRGRMNGRLDPSMKWLAIDVQITYVDGTFDLGDLDLFDADSKKYLGDEPEIVAFLLPDGQAAGERDPVWKTAKKERFVLAYKVPAYTGHVSLSYWDRPIPGAKGYLDRDGPTYSAPSFRVTAWSPRGRAAKGWDRHEVLVEAADWSRVEYPAITLETATGDSCDVDRVIETFESRREPLEKQPYFVPKRFFFAELWCRAGLVPVKAKMFPQPEAALPPVSEIIVPAFAREALKKARRSTTAAHAAARR